MTKNIYALLVGIDAYTYPVKPLQGCVNDIQAIEEYLQGRVAQDDYQLHLRTLTNQDATKQAIIAGFREHLSQATSEDIALFYYAGHGAQNPAPREFWHIEPDRLNETIVCYDSRNDGIYDLADKEIAKLIEEVAQNNPHFLIIMDCCHSGSGTRDVELDVAVRNAPMDTRQRPLDSFLVNPGEMVRESHRSLEADSKWMLAQGKYIFLSACRDRETAKEYNDRGTQRGTFSHFLLDTLQQTHGNITYRDLFKQINALVRAQQVEQTPQIEANATDLDQPFLGGAIATQTPYFTVSYQPDYGWVIDGGAVHGISVSVDSEMVKVDRETGGRNRENISAQDRSCETTELAIFSFDTPVEGLSQSDQAIATASVDKVLPQLSTITVSNLDPNKIYKAIVTSLPLPPKGVYLTGEALGVVLARQTFQKFTSLYVTEVSEPAIADWHLIARNGQYIITKPQSDRPLVEPINNYNISTAKQVLQRLEHIARWTNIAELASSATSRIAADAIKISISHNERELIGTDIRLSYERKGKQWCQPSFKVQLTNTSNLALYCSLLHLSDDYEVDTFLTTDGVWLQPGESAWALDGQEIHAQVDDQLWQQGITEAKDILKLIVSTAEFDATLLKLNKLDAPTRAVATTPKRGQGTLNNLMSRVHRGFSTKPETKMVYDDWITSLIHFTTVRPQETIAIPHGSESQSLGIGVTLKPHPNLQAKACLTTVQQSTRSINYEIVPPVLQQNSNLVRPFSFTTSRESNSALEALELSEVQNPEAVTKTNPLQLVVDKPLAEDEQLLPLVYDGEFFLPLGWGQTLAGGQTEINLTRLPSVSSEGENTRSLGGSFLILFQKIVSQKLKREFKYPLLAVADVSPEETVTYAQNIEQVKARVAEANNIILYIHGIIGDTEDMVRSIRRTTVNLGNKSQQLHELYDLVLTFDYENLHTPIEENARLLKQRLEEVGLGADHDKNLHIVAHSMGGLVSRWFIEREGGNAIANYLIMLGTPNAGSPWSTVEDWAVTMLGIGLNGLSTISWSVPVIGMLLKVIGTAAGALEAIDVSLDQMKPGSQFLQNLAVSPDPGIPYTIVAGNTSLLPAAFKSEANKTNLITRLMQKLSTSTVNLVFFHQPNDIAVEVDSIKSIESDRIYPPQIQEVACDHLVYFYHPEGLKGLAQAINQAWQTDALDLVTVPTNNQPVVRKTAPKIQISPWLLGIIASLIAIVTSIGVYVYWQSQPVEPREQSQIKAPSGLSIFK